MMKTLKMLVLVVLVMLVLCNTAFAVEYTLIDLGIGGASGINDLGQITGWRADPNGGPDKGFVWSKESGFKDIDASRGQAINNLGQIIQRSGIWDQKNGWTQLFTPPEVNEVTTCAINSYGQVAGSFRYTTGGYDAVMWNSPSDLIYLDIPDGWSSWSYDINEEGTVVGEMTNVTNNHAFVWNESTGLVDLGSFNTSFARADGINDLGQIVGQFNPDGYRHAFLWSPNKGITDLGTLTGGHHSQAIEINNNGYVIGWSMYIPGNPARHPFVWDRTAGMTDLGLFTNSESGVGDINSSNQIVGYFLDNQGLSHIALWEPVDMPTYSISGAITLQNYIGNVTTVPISAQLRNGSTTTPITIALQSNGSYSLTDIDIGMYDISFKASHWLRKTITNVAVYEDTTVNATLINGDVDGDNNIDTTDLNILKKANGSTPGSKKWNPNADLNGDNKVTKIDQAILKANLGKVGDN